MRRSSSHNVVKSIHVAFNVLALGSIAIGQLLEQQSFDRHTLRLRSCASRLIVVCSSLLLRSLAGLYVTFMTHSAPHVSVSHACELEQPR